MQTLLNFKQLQFVKNINFFEKIEDKIQTIISEQHPQQINSLNAFLYNPLNLNSVIREGDSLQGVEYKRLVLHPSTRKSQ